MQKLYKLNKSEIKEAIVDYIGIRYEHQLLFPYKVDNLQGLEIAEEVLVELEFVPRGTRT